MSRARWIVAALCLAMSAAPAGAVVLRRGVIGNGSLSGAGSGRALHGTAGQGAVGHSFRLGQALCSGFWCRTGIPVIAVGDRGADLPARLELSAPSPNPTRGPADFRLALPRAARVRLALFDVQGREAARVCDRPLEAGVHPLRWDGLNQRGARAGSGVYFARLWVDEVPVAAGRLVIAR